MTFSIERRVEFRDTDAAGIVHFSAFFPMMESAEHAMLRSLGISVMPEKASDLPPVTWPRIAASCSYTAAAKFEDVLRIEVRVAKLGNSSVEYSFRFTRDGDLIAEGTMAAVCCFLNREAGEDEKHLTKTTIPDPIRALLSRYQ